MCKKMAELPYLRHSANLQDPCGMYNFLKFGGLSSVKHIWSSRDQNVHCLPGAELRKLRGELSSGFFEHPRIITVICKPC